MEVPEAGELIHLDFDPQAGHEQARRRPALVLTPAGYNEKAGLAIVAPITSKQKGYPFEVPLPANLGVTGVVLADQLKSMDWRARNAQTTGMSVPEVLAVTRRLIADLLDL